MCRISIVGFNVLLNTFNVISDTNLPANHLTGATLYIHKLSIEFQSVQIKKPDCWTLSDPPAPFIVYYL